MSYSKEFDIIREYFTQTPSRKDVKLGTGDDCALVVPPPGQQLAITVDTLVAGVHFPIGTSPADIAYKAIVVNLSDLAAMGARPAWLTLALTLTEVQPPWLRAFADSFHQTCDEYGVQLIGGDTTQGPLSVTVQATGFLEPGRVMRRDMAKPGDRIYITGCLGDAALGLRMLLADEVTQTEIYETCLRRLNRPVARVAFAIEATACCACAIDISDGLLADLGHILEASQCGAEIQLAQLPLSSALQKYFATGAHNGDIDWNIVLAGGDDYELCLAVPEQAEAKLMQIASEQAVSLSRIGIITEGNELRMYDAEGHVPVILNTGYEHFA